jgi:hypothetical protein
MRQYLRSFTKATKGKLATVVEAESEGILRATHDLEEIAPELRQSWDEAEAHHQLLRELIAGLPYPERRVLELCSSPGGPPPHQGRGRHRDWLQREDRKEALGRRLASITAAAPRASSSARSSPGRLGKSPRRK